MELARRRDRLAVSGCAGCAFFRSDGSVLFVVQIGQGRYRAISNREDVEAELARHFIVKQIFWRNDFRVSLRAVASYGDKRIWIAGDAAHVHSPVGGMGMNLGVEDASDFASTLGANKDFAAFENRRLEAAQRVIALTDRGYRFASATSRSRRLIRNTAIRAISNISFIRRMAVSRLIQQNAPDFSA